MPPHPVPPALMGLTYESLQVEFVVHSCYAYLEVASTLPNHCNFSVVDWIWFDIKVAGLPFFEEQAALFERHHASMIKNWFIAVCQEWFETLLVPNWYHRSLSVPAECSTTILSIKRSNMARWPKKKKQLVFFTACMWTLQWGGPGQDVMSNAKLSALPWLAVLVIQASCLYATLWPRQQNNSAMGRIWLQVANKTTCQNIWHP